MAGGRAEKLQNFTALILAGSHPSRDVGQVPWAQNKCYLEAAGTPILIRVICALKSSHHVGRIIVVGDEAEALKALPALQSFRDEGALNFMPSGTSAPDSVLRSARTLGEPFPLLVTTGDSALLTAEMVDYFCAELLKGCADLSVAFASGRLIQERFPETQRTYLRFKDDNYSSCNLFGFQTAAGLKAVEFWRKVIRYRKKPWRLFLSFGILTAIKLLVNRPTLVEALDRASKRLGLLAEPIELPFPEAAIDVDKPADLELAEKILLARQ